MYVDLGAEKVIGAERDGQKIADEESEAISKWIE